MRQMIKTDARIKKETAKAYLLERQGAGQVWVPKSHSRLEQDGTVSVSDWLKKDRHGFFTYENQRREQPMGMFNVKKGVHCYVAKASHEWRTNAQAHTTTKENWFGKEQLVCAPSEDARGNLPVAVKQGWYGFVQGDWVLMVHEDYVSYA